MSSDGFLSPETSTWQMIQSLMVLVSFGTLILYLIIKHWWHR